MTDPAVTAGAAIAPTVRYAVERAIATLTLDSPANRNALTTAMMGELVEALATATADPAVRAIVLTHTGSTFCAGFDLREQSTEDGPRLGTAALITLLRTIIELPKPVVARLDGHVRGGGVGLAGACDIAIGSPAVTFAFPEARLGLAPAIISLTTRTRMPDRAVARYWLTGEVIDAPTGERLGLLTECAPQLDVALDRVLDALRAAAPGGLAETKALTTALLRAGFDQQAEQLQELSTRMSESAEAREGMRAFLEKRPPNWTV